MIPLFSRTHSHTLEHSVYILTPLTMILTLLMTSSLLLTPDLANLVLGVGVAEFLGQPGLTTGPHSSTHKTWH